MAKTVQFLLALFSFAPLQAWACPLCHSDTASEVRAGIAQTSLDGFTIPALIMPFVALAIIVSAILVDWDEIFQKTKFTVNKTEMEPS